MDKPIEEKEENKPICGIVMPISEIDGCPASHWSDVLTILKHSIALSGFKAELVSDSDVSGIIQRRIIQNLYKSEIVICDVSAKNPNVMFELGIRLAFDKPTIIIKDEVTDYSFDTSIIEHITYPRELHHGKIEIFMEKLKSKIVATHEASKDPKYTTFLKNFGEFTVAKIDKIERPGEQLIIESLQDLRNEISLIKGSIPRFPSVIIYSASYGVLGEALVDVTDKIKSLVAQNNFEGRVTPTFLGVADPVYGKVKYLTVHYRFNGKEQSTSWKDGMIFNLLNVF